jgi:hypothetical protein
MAGGKIVTRGIAALLLLGVFALGVFASPIVIGLGRLVQGSVAVRCVGNSACVGDTARTFLMSYHLEDHIGGVSAVFCGPSGSGDWIFMDELIRGQACSQPSYAVEFRTRTTRTVVVIEGETVREITQGPLHIIDL